MILNLKNMDFENLKADELPLLLKKMGIFSKKELSQCFLINHKILEEIVKTCDPSGKNILEIGPGPALLTSMIVKKAKKVLAYELDKRFAPFHKKQKALENVEFIYEDFLKSDISNVFEGDEKWTIIGNIPYAISGLIFRKIFLPINGLDEIYLLVQEEVARRLVGDKYNEYGVLAILVWMFGEAEISFVVDSKSFKPVPKVQSAFVKIKRIDRKIDKSEWDGFIKFVKGAFATRRKTITNSIKLMYKRDKNSDKIMEKFKKILKNNEISETIRAERIKPELFLKIYREFEELKRNES